jgi:hypothetical protein
MEYRCNVEIIIMPTISRFCPNCKKYARLEVTDQMLLKCSHCQNEWGKIEKADQVFDRCPICTCRQFYVDKDFNQIIGFGVMAIGIVLVPKTYGLSLPVFALIDWLIYRQVPKLVACYRCGSEYRGFSIPPQLKPFMHHIGLKYDKYR